MLLLSYVIHNEEVKGDLSDFISFAVPLLHTFAFDLTECENNRRFLVLLLHGRYFAPTSVTYFYPHRFSNAASFVLFYRSEEPVAHLTI